jgi:transcriptional regulator with PAS, ATPase and Fis domain
MSSDFRLVSATNRPLNELRRSDLDADFFDRISVLRLHVPPLRDTPEDLGWMWDKMLATTASRAGIAHVDLSDKERSLIVSHLQKEVLPGNYRDLMRIASHILLFIGQAEAPNSRKAAIEKALEIAIEGRVIEGDDPSRELARRYVEGVSAKDLLHVGVDIPEMFASIRQYLGGQIANHVVKKDVKEKTGVAYETANSWKQ